MGDQYLFASSDLSQILESHKRRMGDVIEVINPDELLTTPPHDMIDRLVEEFHIDVPVLQYDRITVDQREDEVDVSQDWRRVITARSRPFYVKGTQILYFIPFEGDRGLLGCVPSTRLMNPVAGEVSEGELVLRYTRLDHDADAVQAEFERAVEKIKQYLGWIAVDVRPFNDSFEEQVRSAIDRRREKLLSDRKLLASLGYELRERTRAPRTYAIGT